MKSNMMLNRMKKEEKKEKKEKKVMQCCIAMTVGILGVFSAVGCSAHQDPQPPGPQGEFFQFQKSTMTSPIYVTCDDGGISGGTESQVGYTDSQNWGGGGLAIMDENPSKCWSKVTGGEQTAVFNVYQLKAPPMYNYCRLKLEYNQGSSTITQITPTQGYGCLNVGRPINILGNVAHINFGDMTWHTTTAPLRFISPYPSSRTITIKNDTKYNIGIKTANPIPPSGDKTFQIDQGKSLSIPMSADIADAMHVYQIQVNGLWHTIDLSPLSNTKFEWTMGEYNKNGTIDSNVDASEIDGISVKFKLYPDDHTVCKLAGSDNKGIYDTYDNLHPLASSTNTFIPSEPAVGKAWYPAEIKPAADKLIEEVASPCQMNPVGSGEHNLYCCAGSESSPKKCWDDIKQVSPATGYYDYVKNNAPGTFRYAYDDGYADYECPGYASYTIDITGFYTQKQ